MIRYRVREAVDFASLAELIRATWGGQEDGSSWPGILARSLSWVCAYERSTLIGFVNVAWDGGQHAFLLDTTVHPDYQRRGIGVRLVQEAAASACPRRRALFEPHLAGFYARCGFAPTAAGLLRLG